MELRSVMVGETVCNSYCSGIRDNFPQFCAILVITACKFEMQVK